MRSGPGEETERLGQTHGTPVQGSDTEVEGENEPRTSLRFPAFAASEAIYGSRGDDDDRSMFK